MVFIRAKCEFLFPKSFFFLILKKKETKQISNFFQFSMVKIIKNALGTIFSRLQALSVKFQKKLISNARWSSEQKLLPVPWGRLVPEGCYLYQNHVSVYRLMVIIKAYKTVILVLFPAILFLHFLSFREGKNGKMSEKCKIF